MNQDNVGYVAKLCVSFMKDTYNIDIEYNNAVRMCTSAIQTILFDARNASLPIADINKRAISIVKDNVMRSQTQLSPTPPPPTPPPLPSYSVEGSDAPSEETKDETGEFFAKLQELELTRNASLAASIQQPVKDPVKATVDVKAAERIAAVNATTSTVVYTSVSSKTAKPIIINGANRMWTYFHDRSVIVWPGPLPTTSDVFRIVLSCLAIPKAKCALVLVDITAATGNNVVIPCHCVYPNVYKPVSEYVATFQPIACPWTIKLLDANGRPLNTGKDGAVAESASRLFNGNVKVTVSSGMSKLCIDVGDTLCWMSKVDTPHYADIIHILGNEIEISSDVIPQDKSMLCNDSAQFSVVFEIQKNDTT